MNLKAILLDEKEIKRSVIRVSHEILERNDEAENIILLGIKSRGVPLAKRISNCIEQIEGINIPVVSIDITSYRDDLSQSNDKRVIDDNKINIDVNDKIVILVDDVIHTGRTARAAIDAVIHHGRPKIIQLAVLIDRGHRELPIRADYVGKNVPTSKKELIFVELEEVDDIDSVKIYEI